MEFIYAWARMARRHTSIGPSVHWIGSVKWTFPSHSKHLESFWLVILFCTPLQLIFGMHKMGISRQPSTARVQSRIGVLSFLNDSAVNNLKEPTPKWNHLSSDGERALCLLCFCLIWKVSVNAACVCVFTLSVTVAAAAAAAAWFRTTY